MTEQHLYLKQTAVIEPLINRWFAWAELIAPATLSMYVANSHVKIMQSFVSAPQVHVAALKNPDMMGGPFLNYGEDRVDQIRELLEKTKAEQADLLALADSIRTVEKMIATEAKGFCMDTLYAKIPDNLRGYVELVYDLNNQPSIRFIEGLLYQSPYFKESNQSVAISLVRNDDRPFAYSTPRLDNDRYTFLDIPFRSNRLDELYKMKRVAKPESYVREILGEHPDQDYMIDTFFTTEAPQIAPAYDGDELRVRYFGHACVLLEYKGVSILCDPVISYETGEGSDVPRYSFNDLPDQIDYVLITHKHIDHFLPETLLHLRHMAKNIVVPRGNGGSLEDPSLKLILKNIGFDNVVELDEMETIAWGDGAITGLPFFGEHADLNIRAKLAFHVQMAGKRIVIGADSSNIEPRLYQHLTDFLGKIDILFIGMESEGAPLSWVYGPLLTKLLPRKMDQSRRFNGSNYDMASAMVDQLEPKEVYIYAMGMEPWMNFLMAINYTETSPPIIESDKMLNHCRQKGITSERLFGRKEMFR